MFSSRVAVALGVLLLGASGLRVTGAQGTEGYVAEVTDRSGSKMTVSAFGFGYKYSYTRSNCMFACGATGDAKLDSLPINDACGVSMVPLSSVKTMTGITPAKDFSDSFGGTITFTDGRSEQVRFGRFGGERLEELKGTSALGPYSLAIDKAASVTFVPDRFVEPKYGRKWAEGKHSILVTCADGASTSLTRAGVFTTSDDGTPGASMAAGLKLKVGESEIDVALDKINRAALKPAPNKDRSFAVTTASGDVIDAHVVGAQWLLAGYKGDSTFYYARIADIREFAISR